MEIPLKSVQWALLVICSPTTHFPGWSRPTCFLRSLYFASVALLTYTLPHARTESDIRSGPIIRPGQTSTYALSFFMGYESFCCSHCVRQTKLLSTAGRYIALRRGPILSPKRNAWFGLFFISLIILNHQVTNSAQEATNLKEWPFSSSAPVGSALSSF